jgi:ectoine hydroxylase-related dioxygenase (phytanoyl-CoA dioxygenase family)
MMWMLKLEIEKLDLGPPVELTPRCGDVLFYHYLLAHSGSTNTSDRPRFALNMKWPAKADK